MFSFSSFFLTHIVCQRHLLHARLYAWPFVFLFSVPFVDGLLLTVCIRVSNSLFILESILMSSMYIKWLIFSCDVLSLYPTMHFFRMWLSGIIAITKSNGDSTYFCYMPVWIFTSAKLFPSAIILQVSIVFSIKYMISSGIICILRCPWCNGYRHRIWTRRHEFKSWTWLIAFHIALMPLGKVWIQLFSLQLWVNSKAD